MGVVMGSQRVISDRAIDRRNARVSHGIPADDDHFPRGDDTLLDNMAWKIRESKEFLRAVLSYDVVSAVVSLKPKLRTDIEEAYIQTCPSVCFCDPRTYPHRHSSTWPA
jgi:hypothetical protein